jgi:hypothetical protein
MHVGGVGDAVKMAAALRSGLAESKTPLATPAPAGAPPEIDLDTTQLDRIIGVKGQANGCVYQFGVPRRDPVTEDGIDARPGRSLSSRVSARRLSRPSIRHRPQLAATATK